MLSQTENAGSQPRREFLRYSAAVGFGLIADLAAARTALALGVQIELAAVIGVAIGAAFSYVLLEFWAFPGSKTGTAVARPVRYLGVLCITMAVRAGTVWIVGSATPDQTPPMIILGAAVAVSFSVNFLLSKNWVFAAATHHSRPKEKVFMYNDSSTIDDTDWEIPEFESLQLSPKRHDAVLVIPVLNEGERIQNQLRTLASFNHAVDVVIADGGSTDGSLEAGFLGEVGVRARLTKIGPGKLSAQLRMAYAWSLRQGYNSILTVDGNGKDTMESIPLFLEKIAEGYDYIQGSRYHPDGEHENTPLERTLANRLIHAPVLSLASRIRLTDTTNGYRAYSARFLLDPRVRPFREVFVAYELLFYLTVRAGQLNMRVTEAPVGRRYPGTGTTPTKITGFMGKLHVLKQTVLAAFGGYKPRN